MTKFQLFAALAHNPSVNIGGIEGLLVAVEREDWQSRFKVVLLTAVGRVSVSLSTLD